MVGTVAEAVCFMPAFEKKHRPVAELMTELKCTENKNTNLSTLVVVVFTGTLKNKNHQEVRKIEQTAEVQKLCTLLVLFWVGVFQSDCT